MRLVKLFLFYTILIYFTLCLGSRPEKSMVACVHHFHCSNGLSCDYKHTPEEEKIFKTFPGGTYKLRTNECTNRSVKHDKVKCPYFHLTPNSRGKVSRDVICLNCHLVGHFPENCPSPSRKNRQGRSSVLDYQNITVMNISVGGCELLYLYWHF